MEIIKNVLIWLVDCIFPLSDLMAWFGVGVEEGFYKSLYQWLSIMFYQNGISFWNALTLSGIDSALQNLATAAPEAYQTVLSINSTLSGITAIMVGIMFEFRCMKDVSSGLQTLSLERMINNMCILVGVCAVVIYLPQLLNSLFEIAAAIGALVLGDMTAELRRNEELMNILVNGEPGLPTTVFLFIFMINMIMSGSGILVTIAQRLLKILAILPFAGMAVVTLVAGGRVGDTGISYLKSLAGYALEGCLIVLIILFGNQLASSGLLSGLFDGIIFDEKSMGFWRIVCMGLCQIIACGATSALVKRSEDIVHRVFAL